ncbi:hypothetical protein KUV39_04010 [Phaeobacter italicus]|uniref:hypothetical protein n=1 Tax=Phaeobacter italicus TaxID=481446 RepID=UPI001C957565|nr:hypothetical protein [Phaeobacter italicus]MBY5975794.1 hypothetical protein [Phaeobacter italicus]
MSFQAEVFKILIASPADVEEERTAISQVISRWNDLNAERENVVLLPVKWETHSAPLMGDRAQGIINNQVVHTCDMAIGVFWTRLGTPTGVSESGTTEEIDWFIENNRPVMLYFSSRAIEPKKVDLEQFKNLKDFESRMQKIGLTGSYKSIEDLREQLLGQITNNVRDLLQGIPKPAPSESEVKEKVKTIKKIAKSGKIYIEDYEKDGEIRSFVVKGDTKPIKEEIKELGGKWNRSLMGWIFPKTRELEIAEFLKQRA